VEWKAKGECVEVRCFLSAGDALLTQQNTSTCTAASTAVHITSSDCSLMIVHQMGHKRSHQDMEGQDKGIETARQSPFMPMFERFRYELDEHHDRRERIIKASRDITAASKKM
jgi:hypothetical protein